MNHISQKVIQIVAQSLSLEEEEIQLTSHLFSELGVTSLDFLDITFALESEFEVQIRNKEFDLITRANMALDGEEESDTFSREVIEMLSKWIPELKECKNASTLTREEIFEKMTVQSIVFLLQSKLEESS